MPLQGMEQLLFIPLNRLKTMPGANIGAWRHSKLTVNGD
jgi:hypothetical protein